jgi:pimeloyl-ACP methyl ester carboxylesterase
MEQTYRSAKRVYDFLGAPDGALRIMYRPAGHETWPTVIERYLDWCDLQFGRGRYAFPERFIHPWDWDGWRANAASLPDSQDFPEHGPDEILTLDGGTRLDTLDAWNRHRAALRVAVSAMLGTPPPGAKSPGGTYGEEPDHIEMQLGRFEAGDGLQKEDLVFGEYVNADVYLPREIDTAGVADDPIPAVLWLHPAHNAHGYGASYRRGEQFYRTLARNGYAVFCFDQIGYGRRVEEVEGFYARHPDWSLLGKMVRDARAALDAMERLPYVDRKHVYVVGYGLGAMVAEHLAVYDDRPAGYALVCGPQPFRRDRPGTRLGGTARWAKLHMWLPNLGVFEEMEDRIPYDVPDLMGAMAPRPVCIVTPTLDRESNLADMTAAVESARQVYALHDAGGRLTQWSPEDYNRFGPETQGVVIDWLNSAREN